MKLIDGLMTECNAEATTNSKQQIKPLALIQVIIIA